MQIASGWGIKLGVDTVSDLNNQIMAGGFNELVLVQEALQERRISEIASDIVSRNGVKFVMSCWAVPRREKPPLHIAYPFSLEHMD